MASVGLVLGAGGIVGGAYHAGTLTALAEAGFDARNATVIVGTSAGSGTAAILRAGFPPADMAPRALDEPVSAEAQRMLERSGGPPELDLRPRPFSRLPLPSSPGLALRVLADPAKAVAGLMPEGTIPTDVIAHRIERLYDGRRWPGQPLWICAVRLSDGKRVVFGRDDVDAPVGVAVQASSAIPGFFRPVVHDGVKYVDGGLHSPTNADLLAGLELDIVVVISPMSATRRAAMTAFPTGRPLHGRRLAGEIATLRRSGTPVLTFQPTRGDVDVMGRNAMDPSRREATVRQALASARERLADPSVAGRVDLLTT